MQRLTPSSSMKRLGLLLMACFVGAPLAAAPVLGQISFHPLTISGKTIKVVQAYGPNDEDCVFESLRVPRPNGLTHIHKTLVCND